MNDYQTSVGNNTNKLEKQFGQFLKQLKENGFYNNGKFWKSLKTLKIKTLGSMIFMKQLPLLNLDQLRLVLKFMHIK